MQVSAGGGWSTQRLALIIRIGGELRLLAGGRRPTFMVEYFARSYLPCRKCDSGAYIFNIAQLPTMSAVKFSEGPVLPPVTPRIDICGY